MLADLAGYRPLGCALMREPLIAPYLKSGELVKIFAAAIDDGGITISACVRIAR